MVSINCGVFGKADVSMASELEEAAGVFGAIFLQFFSAVIPWLSVPAGIISYAPVPPVELDRAADEAVAIFGLGIGKGFGGGGGVGLGDDGFLGGN